MSARVDLVIKQEGGEYCLYTSDGSRKLGCHPSMKEAQAQEAAIKARQAQAAKLFSEEHRGSLAEILQLAASLAARGGDEIEALADHFRLAGGTGFIDRFGCDGVGKLWSGVGGGFDACKSSGAAANADDPDAFCGDLKAAARECGIDVTARAGGEKGRVQLGDLDLEAGIIDILPNGNVIVERPLAKLGENFVNGNSEFDLTLAQIDQAVKNLHARGFPIPVTRGHYPDDERQRQPAAAWIHDLFVNGVGHDELWGKWEILAETWGEIRQGKWRGASMEFFQNDKDVHGKDIGFNIDGAAILNYGFFPVRIDQQRADPRRGERYVILRRLNYGADAPRTEAHMDKPTGSQAGAGEKIELAKADHEKLLKEKADLEKKVKDLEAASAGKEDLQKQVQKLERGRSADRIRALVTQAKAGGCTWKLGDLPIDKSDDEAIEALEKGVLGGVTTIAGLERCVREVLYPTVKLGGERPAGDAQGQAPAGIKTEAGKRELVLQRVEELRKKYEGDLEFMLLKRRCTVYELARRELEGEYRGVKFPAETVEEPQKKTA